MTLDQKIGLLSQLEFACYDPASRDSATGPLATLGFGYDELERAGTVLNARDAEKKALVRSMDKADPIFMHDIIHGYRTIYPINLGVAASFNPDLAEECASMAAKEAYLDGLHATFAPMADLARDARWGRVMESSGEDPYLGAKMTAATVKGFQGELGPDGKIGKNKIAACVKHFAAYGAAEAGRDYNTVDMSERTLREYYLGGYKAAIDAGVKMVMTSFNIFDGVPATANSRLMKEILRDDLGFNGVLISDHSAVNEISKHGCAASFKDAAEMAIKAGVDIDMMSLAYAKYLKQLVEEGKVSESQIDECVARVQALKDSVNDGRMPDAEAFAKAALSPEHREIARRAACESAVLLKNDGLLPLSSSMKKVSVIGPMADTGEIIGRWQGLGMPQDTVTVLQGIRNALPEAKVTYAKGCNIQTVAWRNPETNEVGKDLLGTQVFPDEAKLIKEAVRQARKADAVVLCLGEWPKHSGESFCKTKLELPQVQYRLLDAVMKVNSNVAVLLFTGRPLAIGELNAKARAILNMWQPGTEGGNAAADLVFGKSVPCGRLPMSFPHNAGQCPIYYNRYSTARPRPAENEFKIYTTAYVDCPNKPLFPFGYGLSYTDFEYSRTELSSTEMKEGGRITASCTVTNTGNRAAKETVQFYINDPFASAVRPLRELKGFRQIVLQPGQSEKVSFEITEDTLAFFGADLVRKAEKGDFNVWIGHDSETDNKASFTLV